MSRIRIFFLLLAFCIIPAINATELTDRADRDYSAENYTSALTLYQQALLTEGSSSDLYYNLGNTYYRLDSIGNAVLNYERALKLDPTNADASFNLDFVKKKHNLTAPSKASTTAFFDKLTTALKANTWAVLSIIAFVILLACIGVYILGHRPALRKTGFFGGFIMIFIVIFAVWIAVRAHRMATSHDTCVVMVPSAQLSTVPARPQTPAQQAFTVPEGYTLEIVDSVKAPLDRNTDMWYLVEVDNDNRAYISDTDVCII